MAQKRSSRKLSRRSFGLLASAPLAVTAAVQDARPTQTPAATPQRPISPAIARFDVPMATEPGFIFKP